MEKLRVLLQVEKRLKTEELTRELLFLAKDMGYIDRSISDFTGKTVAEIRGLEEEWNIHPVYKMVDTCAAEFDAATPYSYSTYGLQSEVDPKTDRKKVMVIGSGPDVYKRQTVTLELVGTGSA